MAGATCSTKREGGLTGSKRKKERGEKENSLGKQKKKMPGISSSRGGGAGDDAERGGKRRELPWTWKLRLAL